MYFRCDFSFDWKMFEISVTILDILALFVRHRVYVRAYIRLDAVRTDRRNKKSLLDKANPLRYFTAIRNRNRPILWTTIVNCSARWTRWYAPNGIRWNGTRSCPAGRDTCPSGPSITVACCTNGWAFSRAEKSQDTLPAWRLIRAVTFLLAIATVTSSFGAEVRGISCYCSHRPLMYRG